MAKKDKDSQTWDLDTFLGRKRMSARQYFRTAQAAAGATKVFAEVSKDLGKQWPRRIEKLIELIERCQSRANHPNPCHICASLESQIVKVAEEQENYNKRMKSVDKWLRRD